MRRSAILYFFIFSFWCTAQDNTAVDSLLKIIYSSAKDTSLAKSYIDIGMLYEPCQPDSSEIYYQKALDLSEKLSSKKYIALSKNKIGNSYLFRADYGKAIEYYLASLKLYENMQDRHGTSRCYNNIGIVYMYQKNHERAIDYLETSLKIAQELNDKPLIASKYINLGYVYNDMKDYSKSQEYYYQALKLFEESGDRRGISTCYINIGVNHKALGNLELALEYYIKALEIKKELDEKKGLSIININIAEIKIEMKKYNEAVSYALTGLDIAKMYSALEIEKDAYKMLFTSSDSLRNYKDAYKYHKLYMQANDSIYNENSSRNINELLTQYGTDKKEKENEILKKESEIRLLELDRQTTFRNYLLVVTLLVIVLVVFAFYRLYLKRKAHGLLKIKNELIRKQKNELSMALNKLNELNATKDKFFSIIGHDLRTPFQAIIGFSELLKNEKGEFYTDRMRNIVNRIHNAGKNTSELLSNLLEWSRSQTGSIEYNPEKFLLKTIFDNEIDILIISASKKGISISVNSPGSMEVFADKNMVSTVIRNLISNAIKFTPENGNIRIYSEDKGEFIETTVADSGVGIDNNFLDKIFDIDFKTSTLGTNSETGTGLGLILCKEFIEKNNGNIFVQSVPGEGSSFIFTLPSAS